MSTNYNLTAIILLSVSCILIAAGGNVINDILDYSIDLMNKPTKVIVGKKISVKQAYLYYFILNALALLILTPIYKSFLFNYFLIFPFTILLLWVYSRFLKKKLLIGNFMVSFLSSFTILIIPLYVISLHIEIELQNVFVLAVFAFLLSFSRELIKDAEDMEGDKNEGAKTFPIVAGKEITNYLSSTIILITLGITIVCFSYGINTKNLLFAIWFLLISIMLIMLLWKTFGAKQKKQYHLLSQWHKLIMLLGIISVILLV